MDRRDRELEVVLQEKNDALTQRQTVDRKIHDRKWRSDPVMRLYNRASQKLRTLRVQQQYLMSSRRFEEAAQVAGLADRQWEEETIENQFQRFVSYRESRKRLDQKHSQQNDTLWQAGETKKGVLTCERERRTRRFTKRMVNLTAEEERAKDPDRLWALAHRRDGDPVVNLVGSSRSPLVRIPKKADVSLFNTLPLPPLPPAHSPRKKTPRGSSARWVVAPF
jgi:hypothetical protein